MGEWLRRNAAVAVAALVVILLLASGAWWLWTWHLRPIEVVADRSVPGQITVTLTGPEQPGFYVILVGARPMTVALLNGDKSVPEVNESASEDEKKKLLGSVSVACIVFSDGLSSVRLKISPINKEGPVEVFRIEGKLDPPTNDYTHCTSNTEPRPNVTLEAR